MSTNDKATHTKLVFTRRIRFCSIKYFCFKCICWPYWCLWIYALCNIPLVEYAIYICIRISASKYLYMILWYICNLGVYQWDVTTSTLIAYWYAYFFLHFEIYNLVWHTRILFRKRLWIELSTHEILLTPQQQWMLCAWRKGLKCKWFFRHLEILLSKLSWQRTPQNMLPIVLHHVRWSMDNTMKWTEYHILRKSKEMIATVY